MYLKKKAILCLTSVRDGATICRKYVKETRVNAVLTDQLLFVGPLYGLLMANHLLPRLPLAWFQLCTLRTTPCDAAILHCRYALAVETHEEAFKRATI